MAQSSEQSDARLSRGEEDVEQSTNQDSAVRRSTESEASSRPLSNEERQALLERERVRMASASYRQTLEDPSDVLEAHLRHHSRHHN